MESEVGCGSSADADAAAGVLKTNEGCEKADAKRAPIGQPRGIHEIGQMLLGNGLQPVPRKSVLGVAKDWC